MRFNDFAFAIHAVVLSAIVYSQFWPFIWGFKVSRFQRVSKPVAGLFWGSILAVAVVSWIVLAKSPNNGYDPFTWAWIDVVSSAPKRLQPCLCVTNAGVLVVSDLRLVVCETGYHGGEIRPTSMGQLQAQVHRGMEYRANPFRSVGRNPLAHSAGRRFQHAARLERHHGQPRQIPPIQRHHRIRLGVCRPTLYSLSGFRRGQGQAAEPWPCNAAVVKLGRCGPGS